MSPHFRTRAGLPALALGASLLAAGCSDPPPPAPAPTGSELDRAWRIAVGPDPLDRTIAQLYAQALNARDAPAVVVENPEEDATALALELEDQTSSDSLPAEPSPQAQEDDRYEIVVARTMPLAEALDAEGYKELISPQPDGDLGPAAAPEDLSGLIEDQLDQAQMLTPAEAVMRSSMLITSITETGLELDADQEASLDELAAVCDGLTMGVRNDLAAAAELLEQVYGCAPEELIAAEEDELIQALVTAEIDAALVSGSHPGVYDHELTVLADSRRAFPHDQYAPVVASHVAENIPEVADEISAALDDEELLSLRRLIHGHWALGPQEAAEYWLVENNFIAEPADWG